MIKKKRQREIERERAEWARNGRLYCVVWDVGGKSFGPHSEDSLDEARKNVADMIRRERREIPDDLHARRGTLVHMVVHIEEYKNGQWVRVEGSEKSCVYGVDYADSGFERPRR